MNLDLSRYGGRFGLRNWGLCTVSLFGVWLLLEVDWFERVVVQEWIVWIQWVVDGGGGGLWRAWYAYCILRACMSWGGELQERIEG